jgi:hypothetical protein
LEEESPEIEAGKLTTDEYFEDQLTRAKQWFGGWDQLRKVIDIMEENEKY